MNAWRKKIIWKSRKRMIEKLSSDCFTSPLDSDVWLLFFLQNIDLCLIMWSLVLEFRKNQVRIFQFMKSFLHGFCHRLLLNLSKYLVMFYLNFYKPFDISHDAVFPLITEGHRGQGDASIHHFCAMNIMSFKLSEFSAFISKRQGFCFRSSG